MFSSWKVGKFRNGEISIEIQFSPIFRFLIEIQVFFEKICSPKKSFSNLAVTGLYFFDNDVIKYSENLKPSKRKEIEIVDLLNKYRKKNKLSAQFLGRGGAWLDTGSIKDFYSTSAFVSTLEKRQGLKIACLEEIALNNKWINKYNIMKAMKFYGKCNYSQYLSTFIRRK